jgi:D-alanine-D-alanine ligase
MARKKIAVMFGGRSVEHEISIITGLQMIRAIDVVAYEPIPIYVSASGRWYAGPRLLDTEFYRQIPQSFDSVSEVTLLPVPNLGGLTILSRPEIVLGERAYEESSSVLPVDVYFPTFHGTYGEDGCMQGLLDMAEVAYTGSGVLASALSMSKQHCKEIVSFHGVPVLPSLVVLKQDAQRDLGKGLVELRSKIIKTDGFTKFPLFVKPCNLGSSIGVARAENAPELDAALLRAFKYDTAVMVEPCLDEKMEINVAVLDDGELIASVTEIPVSSSGKELSYEDKYMRGGSKKGPGLTSQGMAALTRVIDPPDLSPELKDLARQYARKAFQALGCTGVARIDFMLDLATNKLYFNEINPLPGSMSFYLWSESKPPIFYTDLIARIIERARQQHQHRMGLSRDLGFKAMFKSS